jgi:hypothetical protein
MRRWAGLVAALAIVANVPGGALIGAPPARADDGVSTFSVTFASPERSGTLTPFPDVTPEQCKVVNLGDYWVVALHGQSGGQGYTLSVSVDTYAGPGTYTGDAASGTVRGEFETTDASGFGWGGYPPAGTPGRLAVGGTGKQGSFDLTLRPIVNSPLPNGSLMHISGTFDCPGYGPEPSTGPATPEASQSEGQSCSSSATVRPGALAAGERFAAGPVDQVDLAVARIEVVQAVQDTAGSVPLIAQKATVVRVFVQKLTAGEAVGAYVTLTPTGPDGRLLRPMTTDARDLPEWPRLCVVALDSVDRTSFQPNEAQFFIYDPPEGTVTFVAKVTPAVGSGQDTVPGNDSDTVSATFQPGHLRRVAFVGVCAGTDSQRNPVHCPEREFVAAADADGVLRAREMLPTPRGGLQGPILPGPNWVWPGQTWFQRLDPRVNAGGLLLAWMRSRYLLMQSGMVASRIDFLPEVVVGVVGGDAPVSGDALADSNSPGLGAGHTGWVRAGGTVGAAFPILLGQLWGLTGKATGDCASPPTTGEPGFELSGRLVFKPPTSADFLTGCGTSSWIGPDAFKTLFANQMRTPLIQRLPKGLTSHLAALQGAVIDQAPPSGDFLLVTGAVRQDGTVGELAPAIRLTPASPLADELSPTKGSFCLELSGSSGTLDRRCFDLAPDPATGSVSEQDGFSYLLPLPVGATRLALTANGTELDALSKTPNAPVISVASHAGEAWDTARDLTWSVTDADGGAIDVNVVYSPDGGNLWLPYAPNWPGASLTIDPSELQAGNRNMFRLIASDGFNTTAADIGPISVPSGVGQELGMGGGCEFARDCEPQTGKPASDAVEFGPIALVVVLGLVGVLVAAFALIVVMRRRPHPVYAGAPQGWTVSQGPSPVGTHVVPPTGLLAWPTPDPRGPAAHQLGPGLQVSVVEWRPDGWAMVVATDGTSGWVDGRLLVPRSG